MTYARSLILGFAMIQRNRTTIVCIHEPPKRKPPVKLSTVATFADKLELKSWAYSKGIATEYDGMFTRTSYAIQAMAKWHGLDTTALEFMHHVLTLQHARSMEVSFSVLHRATGRSTASIRRDLHEYAQRDLIQIKRQAGRPTVVTIPHIRNMKAQRRLVQRVANEILDERGDAKLTLLPKLIYKAKKTRGSKIDSPPLP